MLMRKQSCDSVSKRSRPTQFEVDARLLKISHLIYDRWRQAAARYDLTPSQIRFLKALHHKDNVPMSHFPQVFPCTKSNVTGVVDSLEQKGLVMREPDATDRRVVRIRLTEQGKALATRLPPSEELFAGSPTRRLAPDELEQLWHLLEKVEKGGG